MFAEKLKELTKKGFVVSFNLDKGFEENGAGDLYAYAGDLNYPHQKEFDENDGHGHTMIDIADELLDRPFAEQLTRIFQEADKRVIKKPGSI